jgi:XTP/dITP diphosphohydrolase
VKVVLATRNAGKLREVRAILAPLGLDVQGLPDGVVLPDEGDAYAANAIAKAAAAARATGCVALGDDSGLEVAALGGAPGPSSARWGGPGLDDAGRNAKLLEALASVRDAERAARFVCFAALATPDGDTRTARGVCEGAILRAPCGTGGFGYDPIFAVRGRSLAELGPAEKDALSHRGRAFRTLAPRLVPLASRRA